jgi:hypothetical protein
VNDNGKKFWQNILPFDKKQKNTDFFRDKWEGGWVAGWVDVLMIMEGSAFVCATYHSFNQNSKQQTHNTKKISNCLLGFD